MDKGQKAGDWNTIVAGDKKAGNIGTVHLKKLPGGRGCISAGRSARKAGDRRDGNGLAKSVNATIGDQPYEVKNDNLTEIQVNKVPTEQVALKYDLMPGTIVLVFFVMLLVTMISVSISVSAYQRAKAAGHIEGGIKI